MDSLTSPTLQLLSTADLIIEKEGYSYLFFLDSKRASQDEDYEEQAIWRIVRYTEVIENGVTTTKRMYPSGSKLFNFTVDNYENYTYQYLK